MSEEQPAADDATPTTGLGYLDKSLIVLGALLVMVLGLGGVRAYQYFHARTTAIQSFDASTSAALLIGKTPDQIVKLLGPPYYDTRADKGADGTPRGTDQDCVIVYAGPWRDTCRIEVVNGKAATVDHYQN